MEGAAGLAGDAGDGRRRIFATALGRAGLSRMDLSQRRSRREFFARAGRRLDLAGCKSWIGPDGAGLAMARLADERGYFGRAIQSLVIEKR